MKFTSAPGAVAKREVGGSQELLVPIQLNNGSAEIVQEIIW